MTEVKTPPTQFRLKDPAVAKDPGLFFADLRSRCPVARTDAHGGSTMVPRYDDVHAAAIDTAVFSSANGVSIPHLPKPPLLCLIDYLAAKLQERVATPGPTAVGNSSAASWRRPGSNTVSSARPMRR